MARHREFVSRAGGAQDRIRVSQTPRFAGAAGGGPPDLQEAHRDRPYAKGVLHRRPLGLGARYDPEGVAVVMCLFVWVGGNTI